MAATDGVRNNVPETEFYVRKAFGHTTLDLESAYYL